MQLAQTEFENLTNACPTYEAFKYKFDKENGYAEKHNDQFQEVNLFFIMPFTRKNVLAFVELSIGIYDCRVFFWFLQIKKNFKLFFLSTF